MSATDLLKDIQKLLQSDTSNLLDLPKDAVILDNGSGDVTSDHLKCSIAVTAGIRATKHFEQTGKSTLEDEEYIKEYLLCVIGADEHENKVLTGVLWLCLHIQKSPFLTREDHNRYLIMFEEATSAFKKAKVNPEFQSILRRALVGVLAFLIRGIKGSGFFDSDKGSGFLTREDHKRDISDGIGSQPNNDSLENLKYRRYLLQSTSSNPWSIVREGTVLRASEHGNAVKTPRCSARQALAST